MSECENETWVVSRGAHKSWTQNDYVNHRCNGHHSSSNGTLEPFRSELRRNVIAKTAELRRLNW